MAKKTKPRPSTDPANIPMRPSVSTRSFTPESDGRVRGIDGSVWLWRSVPLGSLKDARDDAEKVRLGAHLQQAIDGLANMTSGRAINRATNKSKYRQFKILGFNVPTRFEADRELTTAPILDRYFSSEIEMKRACIIGVRLRASMSFRGVRQTYNEVIDSLSGASIGAPMGDFDSDANAVHRVLMRAGMIPPDMETLRFSDSWWNYSMENFASPNVAYVAHVDHMHYLHDTETRIALARSAANPRSGTNLDDCDTWPEGIVSGDGQSTVTFGAVESFSFPRMDVLEEDAQWAMKLLSDYEALAISIDGFAEPSSTTKLELRSQARKFRADATEHAQNAKQTSVEAQDKLEDLDSMVALYSREGVPSTMVDTRITVAFNGRVDDMKQVSPHGVNIDPMTNVQQNAWAEIMLCSDVQANPHRLDLPSTNVAYAGLGAVQRVGDRPVVKGRDGIVRSVGAFIGLTENDRQPVYVSGSPQAVDDSLPIAVISAGVGSGKTMILLWMAYQWHEMGYDQVIVDPKKTSDHTAVIGGIGGNVVKISDMHGADGPFDPIRFSLDIDSGISLAADMIQKVAPWGVGLGDTYYTDISSGIEYGVKARGMRSTGAALIAAAKDGKVDQGIVDHILKFANTSPMFRLTFGFGNEEQAFSVSKGTTLVMVGDSEFEMPGKSENAFNSSSPLVRTSANLVRLIIRASTSALSGREAKIHIDEAWIIDKIAPGENEALGRLVRSLDLAMFEYTQTPSGPLAVGLDSYVGRGMLGYQKDPTEAAAGMDLFRLGQQRSILDRISTPRENPSTGQPNPDSLQALRFENGAVRGSVFYVTDIKGRMAPVEITLPKDFLDLASTNPSEVRARMASGTLPKLLTLPKRTNILAR